MGKSITLGVLVLSLGALARLAVLPAYAADKDIINAAPSAQDWQALAKLPEEGRRGICRPDAKAQHGS